MTVIAQNISVTYTGTGTVGPFAFNFPISSPDSLTVYQNNVLLNANTYIVTPVNNNYDNGGSVLMLAPVPAGQTLKLQRFTPLTQTRVFADNQPNPQKQYEDGLDKLTEISQELAANQAANATKTYVVAGTGIVVTGTGTLTDPYVVSISTAFGITSFTGAQLGELGQSFVNPSFAATYNGTPTSANITNTDGTDSPHVLTSPFLAATLSGTFTHATTTTTTFTLHATNGVTSPTATTTITWNPRIFSGLGTAGATATVTASGTTAVLSTTDVLASAGLGAETIGQTFGPFTPAAQVIYLLLKGGAHTFTDNVTGFPMAFNAPTAVTFVNQYGATVSMFLYQTVNVLTGTFQPLVAS